MASHYNTSVFYCDLTNNSENLFGCIGLNHKKHCILNKQYSKEEYQSLIPRIIANMKKTGEWGEFLPTTLSPFAYNETVAQEYIPLSREETMSRTWRWQNEEEEEEKKSYLGPEVKVPDSIEDADPKICNQILLCEVTGKPYKIISQEFQFYKTLGIPLPRRCPARRHLDRNALRNPRKLWNRSCAKCHKPIATSYAPDRPEKVFCESCYLASVY
jgi:hypothetical protein